MHGNNGACGKVVCTLDAPLEMESEMTLDLKSDKPQCCFNHRDELDSAVQLPKFRSVGSWSQDGMLYYNNIIIS